MRPVRFVDTVPLSARPSACAVARGGFDRIGARIIHYVEFSAGKGSDVWVLYSFFSSHAAARGCSERLDFSGYVSRVRPVLWEFDRAGGAPHEAARPARNVAGASSSAVDLEC